MKKKERKRKILRSCVDQLAREEDVGVLGLLQGGANEVHDFENVFADLALRQPEQLILNYDALG